MWMQMRWVSLCFRDICCFYRLFASWWREFVEWVIHFSLLSLSVKQKTQYSLFYLTVFPHLLSFTLINQQRHMLVCVCFVLSSWDKLLSVCFSFLSFIQSPVSLSMLIFIVSSHHCYFSPCSLCVYTCTGHTNRYQRWQMLVHTNTHLPTLSLRHTHKRLTSSMEEEWIGGGVTGSLWYSLLSLIRSHTHRHQRHVTVSVIHPVLLFLCRSRFPLPSRPSLSLA